jgi:hypothetical protein
VTTESPRPQEPAKPGPVGPTEQACRGQVEALRAQWEAQRSVVGRVI